MFLPINPTEQKRLADAIQKAAPRLGVALKIEVGELDANLSSKGQGFSIHLRIPPLCGPLCLPREDGILTFRSTFSLASFCTLHEVAHALLLHLRSEEKNRLERRCDRAALFMQADLKLDPPELELWKNQ